ncbi:MAG TPA: hypothetical protein VJR71_02420 [Pseudolabrys sp.]|nr:hypothetical protein [Pseudolabrys sp.]
MRHCTKSFLMAAAVVLAATSVSLAQSLPNYGPNAPANADSFGQPPSGTKPPGVPRYGHRAYAYRPYAHHHHWYWRHHHRYWY